MSGVVGSIIDAAGGLASNLVGGLFSRKNTKDTNAQNLRIAQMNNEWSERMMEKQNLMNVAQWQRESDFSREQMAAANAFNEKMWQKQADYNSAEAQADRLRAAGLNPALAMSGQNAGTVTGSSSVQGATPSGNSIGLPSPSQATMIPDNFGDYIADAAAQASMLAKNSAETDLIKTNKDISIKMAKARLAQLYEETRDKRIKNNLAEDTYDLELIRKNESYGYDVQKRLTAEAQQKHFEQQAMYYSLLNQQLPDKLAQEILTLAAQEGMFRFNSDVQVGKMIDALKKRGFKLSEWEEKAIFAALLAGQAIK